MSKLTAKTRNALGAEQFAGPGRTYPDEDASHARDALSRVSANGSPALKAQVRAKVHRDYPEMKVSGGKSTNHGYGR